jgi:hypothetical protein
VEPVGPSAAQKVGLGVLNCIGALIAVAGAEGTLICMLQAQHSGAAGFAFAGLCALVILRPRLSWLFGIQTLALMFMLMVVGNISECECNPHMNDGPNMVATGTGIIWLSLGGLWFLVHSLGGPANSQPALES